MNQATMNTLSMHPLCSTDNKYNYGHGSCTCAACAAYGNSPRNYKFESADESAFAYRSFAFDRMLYRDAYDVQVTPSAIYIPNHRTYGYFVIDIDQVDDILEHASPTAKKGVTRTKWWTRILLKLKIIPQSNLLIVLKDGHVRRISAENTSSFKLAVEKAQSIQY